ncbi:MAG: gluconate 2-dehydrogenase subunit 3 family protein [Gammaproteobacteria bacterium]
MDEPVESRRSFLLSSGGALTSAWLASNWVGIAAAAEHANHMASASASKSAPATFTFLSAKDAADVEPITAQILPGGATPGAREAHAVYFIDHALATFFADRAEAFRTGLTNFQHAFAKAQPTAASFAAASPAQQLDFLNTVDRTLFFENVRILTIVGTLSSSKYGGNYAGLGWKLMGFEDQHVFEPPFGYYDAAYKGFVPYPVERKV